MPALLPHLPRACYFIEPCAGRGWLVDHLEQHGHTCTLKSDIKPRRGDIVRGSAFALRVKSGEALFITNPPYLSEILLPLIEHLASQGVAWLLLEADWMHNKGSKRLLDAYCRHIVSIGRISWEQNGITAKNNYAWYQFDGTRPRSFIEFHGPA